MALSRTNMAAWLLLAILAAPHAASATEVVASLLAASAAAPPVLMSTARCGGAVACLGRARLEAVRRRSRQQHQSMEALARNIDSDPDLVRGMGVGVAAVAHSC
jgi:hypothetical protein